MPREHGPVAEMADGIEPPAPEATPWMFLSVLAVSGSAVAIVAIVKGSWGADKWAAIRAFATAIQAVGVVFGVVYASRQISALRTAEDHRRRNELLDKLNATVFDELENALRQLTDSYFVTLIAAREAVGSVAGPAEMDRYRLLRTDYQQAYERTTRILAAAERLLGALGEDNTALLSIHGSIGPLGYLPLNPIDITESYKNVDFGAPYNGLWQLQKTIIELMSEVAPSRSI